MSVEYLFDLADGLLATAQGALAEATTGHPPPEVAFVSVADVPTDFCCRGQLTVHLSLLSHDVFGLAGGQTQQPVSQACATLHRPTFIITLLRCTTTMDERADSPKPDAQDDAAHDLLVDLWALLTELDDRRAACTLFPGTMTACEDVEIGEVEPWIEEGQCAGWQIPVTVVANDTGPTGS